MSTSLRDQLIQAGLASSKQIKQTSQQPYYRSPPKNKPAAVDAQKLAMERAQAAKVARDQELDRQRQDRLDRKARALEVKQLIEQHRLPKIDSEDYYYFVAGKKARRMAVNPELRARLINGAVVVVRFEGRYDLVSADIAERIKERDVHAVIAYNAREAGVDANDPYKDFVVPDDLTW
jgi:uncharacterized protein YaiL (DUF2058 family)